MGITKPPVPVEKIAEFAGVEVRYEKSDDDISGFILRENGQAILGVNGRHPATRQRFTLAHELGHFFLHDKPLFLDSFTRLRDVKSSKAVDPEEIEANAFAAELLMPEEFIYSDIARMKQNVDLTNLVNTLAEKYLVSAQAINVRLTHLGIIDHD